MGLWLLACISLFVFTCRDRVVLIYGYKTIFLLFFSLGQSNISPSIKKGEKSNAILKLFGSNYLSEFMTYKSLTIIYRAEFPEIQNVDQSSGPSGY